MLVQRLLRIGLAGHARKRRRYLGESRPVLAPGGAPASRAAPPSRVIAGGRSGRTAGGDRDRDRAVVAGCCCYRADAAARGGLRDRRRAAARLAEPRSRPADVAPPAAAVASPAGAELAVAALAGDALPADAACP